MTYLSLKSNNPNLSWILRKNPETKMIAKHVRKGFAFGWFSEEDSRYNCHFVDPPDVLSYSNEGFAHLDTTGLTSPYSYLNLMSEFFRSAIEEREVNDVGGFVHELQFNYTNLENTKYLEIFPRHFESEGFLFEFTEHTKDKYSVSIKTTGTRTVQELLNLGLIFLLFAALFDPSTWVQADEELLERYLKSFKIVKVPYQIMYLFKINFVRSVERMQRLKASLEEATSEICNLVYGNTLDNRKEWVKSKYLANPTNYIVDVGCGKEFNYKFLLNLLPPIVENPEAVQYFPIDIDEEVRKEIDSIIQRRHLVDLGCAETCYSSYDDFLKLNHAQLPNSSVTVVCTEVLEHMDFEEAELQILDFLVIKSVKQVLVTLPNYGFNKFYGMEQGVYRHDDHHWEPDKNSDFFNYVRSICIGTGFSMSEVEPIGDQVSAKTYFELEPCSFGFVLTRTGDSHEN